MKTKINNVIYFIVGVIFFFNLGYWTSLLIGSSIFTAMWVAGAVFSWFVGFGASNKVLEKIKSKDIPVEEVRTRFRWGFFFMVLAVIASIYGNIHHEQLNEAFQDIHRAL